MTQETEKVTLRLFRGDKDKISQMFPEIGYNKAIRHIVHNFIRGIEERVNKTAAPSVKDVSDIDINKGA